MWLTPPHLVVGSGKVSFLSVCRAVSKAEREESAAGERSRRKKGTAALAGLLPEVVRKPRKQLSPEELEARRKKVSCPATSPYPFVWMNERWVVRPVLLLYPFVWMNEWWVVRPVLLLYPFVWMNEWMVSCPATSPYPFVWMVSCPATSHMYPFVWTNEWWVVQPVLLLILLYEWMNGELSSQSFSSHSACM